MLKEKNKITNCHCKEHSATRQSHEIASHSFAMTESGRSMVEMLGVLAVMGVLSVAGIAGYTTAMNKHRANELLNESYKRAVVIAAQILSDKSISADMINQFDNNGTTFTGVEAVGTNQFKLTLSDVDDDVCTQLKATVGSNTIIQEVGDKCVFLTFNNDLSKGTTSSGTNGGAGGNEQQEPETTSCPEDFDTHDGCQSCENGNISYKEQGASCIGSDGPSVCNGNGHCCSPDGNDNQKCCELLEWHWTGEFCCESIADWANNFCCVDGDVIEGECCNSVIPEDCCKNNGYRWDEDSETCCSKTEWNVGYLAEQCGF